MNLNKDSYKCPFCCDETFGSVENLKQHIQDLKKCLKCPLCDENCENFESFERHFDYCVNVEEIVYIIETEDDEEKCRNYCEICDVEFKNIDEHLREKHLDQEVILENCPEGLRLKIANSEFTHSEQDAKVKTTPIIEKISHSNDTTTIVSDDVELSNSMKIFRCTECNIRFSNMKNYAKHNCDEEQREICDICSVCFTTSNALNSHKKRSHNSSKKSTECDICHSEFSTEKFMQIHRKTHNNDVVKFRRMEPPVTYNITGQTVMEESTEMLKCKICNVDYNKEYIEIHMKSHVEKKFICTLCNKDFPNADDLEMHSQAHSNEKNSKKSVENHKEGIKKYACNFCGKFFGKAHEKNQHERIHTGEKPYVCLICNKGFRVGYCLTLHMRTHSGVRPYQCSFCEKRFKSHGVYKHHLQTHSDVRSFKCTFCPKAFKTSVQLAGHTKSHTKPFSCDICNRHFASLYALKLHKKSHGSSKNLVHKCYVCAAVYARTFALRDHLLTHAEYVEEGTSTNEQIVTVGVE